MHPRAGDAAKIKLVRSAHTHTHTHKIRPTAKNLRIYMRSRVPPQNIANKLELCAKTTRKTGSALLGTRITHNQKHRVVRMQKGLLGRKKFLVENKINFASQMCAYIYIYILYIYTFGPNQPLCAHIASAKENIHITEYNRVCVLKQFATNSSQVCVCTG